MPKKRKTRKEKMLHDQKRKVEHVETTPVASSPKNETQQKEQPTPAGMTFSLPAKQEAPTPTPQKAKHQTETITVSTNEYGYLSNDLMRTALLTGAIIFAELVIKLFIVH